MSALWPGGGARGALHLQVGAQFIMRSKGGITAFSKKESHGVRGSEMPGLDFDGDQATQGETVERQSSHYKQIEDSPRLF